MLKIHNCSLKKMFPLKTIYEIITLLESWTAQKHRIRAKKWNRSSAIKRQYFSVISLFSVFSFTFISDFGIFKSHSLIHVFWNRAVDRTISMFLFGDSVSPLCKQRNLIFQIPYLRSVIQRVDTWVVLQIISSMELVSKTKVWSYIQYHLDAKHFVFFQLQRP